MSDTFPVISFVAAFRTFLKTAPIAKTVIDLKAAADAVKTASSAVGVAVNDISGLIDMLDGLFGEAPPPVGSAPVGGWLTGLRRRHLIARVKATAQAEYRANGVSGGMFYRGLDFDTFWPKAVEAGAEELILDELSRVEGFADVIGTTPVGGPVIDFFRRVGQWIYTHRDEILAVAKALLLFLTLIGLL